MYIPIHNRLRIRYIALNDISTIRIPIYIYYVYTVYGTGGI